MLIAHWLRTLLPIFFPHQKVQVWKLPITILGVLQAPITPHPVRWIVLCTISPRPNTIRRAEGLFELGDAAPAIEKADKFKEWFGKILAPKKYSAESALVQRMIFWIFGTTDEIRYFPEKTIQLRLVAQQAEMAGNSTLMRRKHLVFAQALVRKI
ncbi:hypothetical protein CH92_19050 [Stutzerimonas stutzeri]|uniref:Uncharacterized protein n=1 Tax=Stutzerimonas stutzeri TaxID=316 RepID=W8R4V8_STUST|nr:hypothetical protein CH92_19050 [Stutzerimonas stutzeri]